MKHLHIYPYGDWRFYFLLSLLVFLQGCTPLIGPYSPVAYQNATSLKVETLAMMDKATDPYDEHKNEVEKLFIEVNKAHEFVQGIPSNSISAEQWAILIKRDGDLMGRFFSHWHDSKTLSKVYIDEFKQVISDSFDQIICLEANKKELKLCNSTENKHE